MIEPNMATLLVFILTDAAIEKALQDVKGEPRLIAAVRDISERLRAGQIRGLEQHLRKRLGELFTLEYDLLLYDVTSTYFEGECKANPKAQRGHSRDKRSDCKQVCLGLVVSKCGMPLGYEVFAGNRHDVKTWQEIVTTMETRYGKADRIWCGDRGMMSKENTEFMQSGNRRYIIGASKGTLKKFERELLEDNWQAIRDGLEVKLCPSPHGGQETYILCRSQDRREKEKAMHDRFEKRIDEALERAQDPEDGDGR